MHRARCVQMGIAVQYRSAAMDEVRVKNMVAANDVRKFQLESAGNDVARIQVAGFKRSWLQRQVFVCRLSAEGA